MQGGPSPADIIIGLLPVVVLLGLLWFFIQRVTSLLTKQAENTTRQTLALERIAVALENRQ
jgi:preprotein translocase subunit YajC